MSSRNPGNLWPFKKLENGMFDLDQWNDEYRDRFENLLQLTVKKAINIRDFNEISYFWSAMHINFEI